MAENEFIEVIRRRAYQIWEGAGRPNGLDIDHWLQAEAEYRSQPVRPNGASSQIGSKSQVKSPAKPTSKARRATAKA